MEGTENNDRQEIFSKSVRAGKRTYFFDVKATKGNDFYLTVTESKKRFSDDGKFHYEKHKLFLYKEDFEKFQEGLQEAIDKIKTLQEEHGDPDSDSSSSSSSSSDSASEGSGSFTDVDFDDLGEK
jgi:hypothetical protein